MNSYAITLSSFRNLEPIQETLSKISKLGFDALEMFGEPSEVFQSTIELLKSSSIPVCGITGMWGAVSQDGWKRRLLSDDYSFVDYTKQYVKDCIDLCNRLGGSEFNICLFADENSSRDRTHRITSSEEKKRIAQRAAPVMLELCKYAQDHGVTLVLEPLNRYSTPFCSCVSDAISIVTSVGHESLGVMLDSFHMNIEEDRFETALQQARGYLRHLHFADNNRKMPGCAHIDFEILMRAIRNIGYDKFISFEPNILNSNYEDEVKKGLDFIKKCEKQVFK